MGHDYAELVQAELTDMSALLADLQETEWDHPSLCEGWAVRHVVGHICLGYHANLAWVALQIVKERGNVERGSAKASKAFGDDHSPAELTRLFGDYAANCVKGKGISRLLPLGDRFTDNLIHHEDIRRPLGRDREVPPERLRAALDRLPGIGGFLKSKKTDAGLRFEATDIDWSWGEGPVVRGPGRDLVLAMSGRPLGLETCAGDGMATLAERIGASA